jgi:hypothetical protein
MLEALVETVIASTGWGTLRLFGREEPGETEIMLVGLAFWLVVGLAILAFAMLFR